MTNLTFICEKCGEPNRYYDGALGFEGAYCEVCGWLQDLNDSTNGSYWHPVPKNQRTPTKLELMVDEFTPHSPQRQRIQKQLTN